MKLRIGSTEAVLLVAGFLGLVEQEMVRVGLSKDPSTLISGICVIFVLLGAGFTLGRNLRIGPLEVSIRPKGEPEDESSREKEPDSV